MLRSVAYISTCFLIYAMTSNLLNPAAVAAASHPFSIRDLLGMERIAAPQVSPDGRWVAFTVWRADLTANRGHISIHITDIQEQASFPINPAAGADDTNPRWSPDGKTLYFLSSRSGSRQVWKASPTDQKPLPVTDLPLDVGVFEVTPDGRALVLSLAVFPGRTPEHTKKCLRKRQTRPDRVWFSTA
jgi:dipeptidyl aminopeptidase/acylaminoacyl peptidase